MPSWLRRKKNATFLLAEHETAWWWRMQSPACGTGARRRGHQISADPAQEKSPASTNGRRMRPPFEKKAPGLGSSPSCREMSSSAIALRQQRIPCTALWHRTWSHPEQWRSPSPSTCTLPTRLVAADEQSTTGRECAPLEINVWNEREMVMATKGAQNIITAKERGWRVRAQERMAKSSIAAAPRCPTLCSGLRRSNDITTP